MKKLILFTFIIMTIFQFNINAYGINQVDQLIIAGDKNYPPYEFIDVDGSYRGFNVDLMMALALEMGIDIKFMPMDWVEAHMSLQDGSIDAIQGMNYNEERKRIYDFSNEYLKNSLAIFVSKDSNIVSAEGLKGHSVAVQRSDSAAYVLADMGEIEVVFFSDMSEAFDNLKNNQVDAVLGNKLTAQYMIQKGRLVEDVKIIGGEINYTSYGMAFKKGNRELADEFNKALESLKKNGTYNKIYEKWFGKEIKPVFDELLRITYFISFFMIFILIVAVFYYRLNTMLKEKVDLRTEQLRSVNEELAWQHYTINESNRFKEQIINGIGNGLVTFDKYGVITTINKSCEEILHIRGSDYVGIRYDEPGFERFFNTIFIKECIEEEKVNYFKEKKVMVEDKEIILSQMISPLYNLSDENIGAVMTFNDITEITTLRMKLVEAEKIDSMAVVVSGISHELRNPLTSIKTYIELLPKKYDNERFRDKITTKLPLEINRLDNLLKDLMNFSRTKILLKTRFDLTKLVNETLDFFLENHEKNIRFNYLDDYGIYIFADIQQIKQVIVNILLNSIDAIEDNGNIKVDIQHKDTNIILTIEDDGCGIEKEHLNNIFDPFYTTKDHGTGLGMSVCYRYLRDNDGEIHISSSSGEGTKIELVFKAYIDKGEIYSEK